MGIDVHKDTHTAAGLTPFGEKVFEMTIGNEAEDFISLVEKTKVEGENTTKNCLSGGDSQWPAAQMSRVLHSGGGCSPKSETHDVCGARISKVEIIRYDFLVSGFGPECAPTKAAFTIALRAPPVNTKPWAAHLRLFSAPFANRTEYAMVNHRSRSWDPTRWRDSGFLFVLPASVASGKQATLSRTERLHSRDHGERWGGNVAKGNSFVLCRDNPDNYVRSAGANSAFLDGRSATLRRLAILVRGIVLLVAPPRNTSRNLGGA